MKCILTTCDRCGAEISRNNLMRILDVMRQDSMDLCKTCEEEFKRFMNMEEKE